tara:strand:- start:2917 stop:3312 length:396 start_codon:yes stop_codon:yes gene_type:complete
MKFVNPKSLSSIGNGVYVKNSQIPHAGYGLYAQKMFYRGDFITLYDGEILSRREAWDRKVLTHMCTREGVYVDGLKTPSMGRGGGSFANSSAFKKDANAAIVANLGNVMLQSLKLINPDDEILVFYTQPYL